MTPQALWHKKQIIVYFTDIQAAGWMTFQKDICSFVVILNRIQEAHCLRFSFSWGPSHAFKIKLMICEKIILDLIKLNCKIKLWTNRLERLCENAVHITDILNLFERCACATIDDMLTQIEGLLLLLIILILLLTNLKTIKWIAWTSLIEILALVLSKLMCNRCK